METQLFNAEEARKLAKKVKEEKELLAKQEEENKKQKAVILAEPIINDILKQIENDINEDKDSTIYDVSELEKDIIDIILFKLSSELKFNISYKKVINKIFLQINWKYPSEVNKDFQDLFKNIFDKHIDYFGYKNWPFYYEHKPVYWFYETRK